MESALDIHHAHSPYKLTRAMITWDRKVSGGSRFIRQSARIEVIVFTDADVLLMVMQFYEQNANPYYIS